jgi:predicted nucleotidyltransferase
MPAGADQFGLRPSIIAMIRDVFAKCPPVTEVRLYGSRAKGNFNAGSDIDLAIMDKDVTGAQLMRIENDIDELQMLYSVDLSLFRQIDNPALTEHILRVGKIFYRADATG